MADEQHRGAVFLAQILDQFDNRRLDRHIQRRGRLVQDQERRLGHQRHGDDDPLLLPTRQLMRIGAHDPRGVGQFHIPDHLQGARLGLGLGNALMDHRHFHQLLADAHRGVQAGHRFLIDHRDFIAANVAQFLGRHLAQIAPLELDRPAHDTPVDAQILHHPQRHGGFAATAFAHQSHGLAGLHGHGKIHHRRDFAQTRKKGNRQFVNLEDRPVMVPFRHRSPSFP